MLGPGTFDLDVAILSTDGYPLRGTYFPALLPPSIDDPRPTGAVLLSPATGVPRSYYRHFASFLAANGFAALTVDLRGIGGSRPRSLRRFPGSMSDWGEKDIGGAIAWLRARHPTVPVVAIGHSSGGWLLPFAPNRGELQGALLVASQNGYFRLWPRKTRWFYGFLWHVATPAITRTVGYLPGRLMGGEDLPPNVAREWARWCTSPEFTRADGPERARAYADFPGPVVAYSFEDDTYAPRESVKSLLSFFERARPVWRVGSPRRVGRPIGHFGVFRPTFRELIWSAMLRDVTAIARAIPPGPALPPFSDGALPGAKGGP